jgi:hypothetical protein
VLEEEVGNLRFCHQVVITHQEVTFLCFIQMAAGDHKAIGQHTALPIMKGEIMVDGK